MILTMVRLLTSLVLDILAGAGATRASLWVNLIWAAALIPALLIGTSLGGIRGTAVAHAIVGLVIALPAAAFALHRAGVRLGPIPRALVRPLSAGLAAAVVAKLVAHVTGPHLAVELIAGGVAGLLTYVAIAVTPDQFRAGYAVIARRGAGAVS
jgi:PST family polysaccharide transporter